MGMKIDEAIEILNYIGLNANYMKNKESRTGKACRLAIETMRKYQKICKILDKSDNGELCMYDTIQEIEEVIEDGNDN